MNLEIVRQRLAALNKPKGGSNGEKREKIDMSLYVWKPKQEGKYVIRIVPSKFDKENPFKEVFLHYGISKFPIYALTNWGEKDPIVELAKKIKEEEFAKEKGTYDKENLRLANSLQPKMRVFVPIIVRGEEDKGVRLWEFGKEIYNQLLQLAENEDWGDYTDVSEGRDFDLIAVKGEVGGRKDAIKTSIQIKPKQTPLSKDAKLVKKWLEEQPDILEIQKTFKMSFEKLKGLLEKFISPEDESSFEGESKEQSNKEFLAEMNATNPPETKVKTKKSAYTPPKGKSKADKFNKLFEEGDNK